MIAQVKRLACLFLQTDETQNNHLSRGPTHFHTVLELGSNWVRRNEQTDQKKTAQNKYLILTTYRVRNKIVKMFKVNNKNPGNSVI